MVLWIEQNLIPNFMSNDVRLAEEVRLPLLVVGQHGSAEVWPPRKLPMRHPALPTAWPVAGLPRIADTQEACATMYLGLSPP
jgi:hypothetical protein